MVRLGPLPLAEHISKNMLRAQPRRTSFLTWLYAASIPEHEKNVQLMQAAIYAALLRHRPPNRERQQHVQLRQTQVNFIKNRGRTQNRPTSPTQRKPPKEYADPPGKVKRGQPTQPTDADTKRRASRITAKDVQAKAFISPLNTS